MWKWDDIKRALGRKKALSDDHLIERADEMIEAGALDTDKGMNTLQALYLADMQRHRAHERKLQLEELRWTRVKRRLFVFFMCSGLITSIIVALYRNGVSFPKSNPIAVVGIIGEVGVDDGAKAENVIPALRRAFDNTSSKAVVLRINSPGGLPTDSERINKELDALKKKHPDKEVTAVIETMGASAAYMVAVHADEVCSGRYSLVGSVGAIVSVYNFSGLAEKLNVKRESFGSGKFKGMLDPFKPVSDDERVKIKTIVHELGGVFAAEVMEKRKGKIKLTLNELATGEFWPGTTAAELGLTDGFCTPETIAAKYAGNLRDYGPFAHNEFGFSETARAIGQRLGEFASETIGVGIKKTMEQRYPAMN
jgi:protease-4